MKNRNCLQYKINHGTSRAAGKHAATRQLQPAFHRQQRV